MADTKDALTQLRELLPVSDLQYQMIADKLRLEILQCGIDYYNDSEAADAACKAMVLQSYAQSVAVGEMAKNRCKKNVDILQKIINNLPPRAVLAEDMAIKEELRIFCICPLPGKITHAVHLLNNTKPHLKSIKAKLGASDAYYLKISTQVVSKALDSVIKEVNDVQNIETIGWIRTYSETKKAQIKSTLRAAWNAIKIMDKFDMESDFRTNRYSQNRSILKNLCVPMRAMYTKRIAISLGTVVGGALLGVLMRDDDFLDDLGVGALGGAFLGIFIGGALSAMIIDKDEETRWKVITIVFIVVGGVIGGAAGGK